MKNEIYYAKAKGWEKLSPNGCFWNYDTDSGKYFLANRLQTGSFVTMMTKEEWIELGVNDSNADFEEVE